MSRGHNRAGARGQAETVGLRWELARGRACGGDHRWKRQAKNGGFVCPLFSLPSSLTPRSLRAM